MSNHVALRKGKVYLDFGPVSFIMPFGSSVEDLNDQDSMRAVIEELEIDIKNEEKDIAVMAAYSPKSMDDLADVKENVEGVVESIKEDVGKLRMLRIIGDLIEYDGFKVEIG